MHSYISELQVALQEQPLPCCPGSGKALPQKTSHTGPGGKIVEQPADKQHGKCACTKALPEAVLTHQQTEGLRHLQMHAFADMLHFSADEGKD